MMPGFGRPPMRSDAFDQLPEEDKKRVREALDKVWGRPEVIEARDEAMKANEKMRDAIRHSLEKIDPEAAAILTKIEPKERFDPRQLPVLPAADSQEYPKALVARLRLELMAFAKPERREETSKLHEKIMLEELVQTALRGVETTQAEARTAAVQKLRQAYREAAMRAFKALREKYGSEAKPK